MNKQLTLGAGFEKYAKTTKRAQFLDDMDRIIVNGNNWGATDVATDNRLRFYWYQGPYWTLFTDLLAKRIHLNKSAEILSS